MFARFVEKTVSFCRWLTPGLGVKRWLALVVAGIALIAVGLGIVVGQIAARSTLLHAIPPTILLFEILLLPSAGTALIIIGLTRMNRALLRPFSTSDRDVVRALQRHRRRGRGPRVVAIGGGHGLSTLLRGLKQHTANITAIVTVADDGGSSGRLRQSLGVLPPGDFRNCIAALADDEALIAQLLQYRFPDSPDADGLEGHTLGNLLITAMADVTGSFERAILELGRVLAIQGQVLPSTLRSVTLVGDLRAAPARVDRVTGESRIAQTPGAIERVYLEPDDAPAYPGAVRAILEADLVVMGPGSLYTSVLPNLLVPQIALAIAACRARRVFVCNVATQRGETDGYAVSDHVTALERHVGPGMIDVILANDNLHPAQPLPEGVELTRLDVPTTSSYSLRTTDLIDPVCPWRHDGARLAQALLRLLEEIG